MTLFDLDRARFAEQMLLGALYQSPADARALVDDLPTEALTDPEHQLLMWRLLTNTVRAKDAMQMAAWTGAGQDQAADAASAVRTIRAAWTARQRRSTEDVEPVFLAGLMSANDLAGFAARGAA